VLVRPGYIQRKARELKTLEDQMGQFVLGYKYPVGWSNVVQKQDNPYSISVSFFLLPVL